MALYKPDYKLEKAAKLIDSLDNSDDNKLIKYYIQKKDEYIKKQNERLKEYQEVFDKMGKFLPNGRATVYGG
jgi:hypothetical protein